VRRLLRGTGGEEDKELFSHRDRRDHRVRREEKASEIVWSASACSLRAVEQVRKAVNNE